MKMISVYAHLEDTANEQVFRGDTPRYLADTDALGALRRSGYDWLQQNAAAKIIILPEIYGEDVSGERLAGLTNKGLATFLRQTRGSLMRHTGVIPVQTQRLTAAQDGFLDDKHVAHEIDQVPGRINRALIAATAIEYGITVLSGNTFYARIAARFDMPGGVYDLFRGIWIVPRANH